MDWSSHALYGGLLTAHASVASHLLSDLPVYIHPFCSRTAVLPRVSVQGREGKAVQFYETCRAGACQGAMSAAGLGVARLSLFFS